MHFLRRKAVVVLAVAVAAGAAVAGVVAAISHVNTPESSASVSANPADDTPPSDQSPPDSTGTSGTAASTDAGQPSDQSPAAVVEPGVIPLPPRDAQSSAARFKDLAVAFLGIGGTSEVAVMDKVVEAGIPRILIVASWSEMCEVEGECDYSTLDNTIALAEQRGLGVIVHINSTPAWVHPDLAKYSISDEDQIWYTPTRTPEELQHWADFNDELSARYAGRVQAYEIWNEENWQDFMKPKEDAVLYASMLHASYLAIKANDPNVQVIFGGTTRSDPGFLSDVYDALATYPEAREHDYFFDQVGVHPYTDEASPDDPASAPKHNSAGGEFDDNFLGFDRVYAEMVRRGDGHKTIFMGEFAYSLDDWFQAESDEVRAYFLRRAYELAAARPWIAGLAWFGFNSVDADDEWDNWSLLRWPVKETATFRELKELLGTRPAEPEQPLTVTQEGGAITASVSDVPEGAEFQLYVNGIKTAAVAGNTASFTPDAKLEGSTLQLQGVIVGDGTASETSMEFLPLGEQKVQVSPTKVDVKWGIDIAVGRTDPSPVHLVVTNEAGAAVVDTDVDPLQTSLPARSEFLLWLSEPGTYTVSVTDGTGDAVAAPGVATVS